MTRGQRRGLGVLHGLTVAVGAAAVAVIAAAVLSVVTPLGSARAYEWDRGFRLDVPALAIGAVVVVVLLTGASAVSAARVARRAEAVPGTASPSGGADRPSRAVELAAGAGAPPAFVVGMRMALQPGRGRTAAPVRSVMTSIALAVALVVATAGFAVDLQRLVSTPPALRRELGCRGRHLVRTHPGRRAVPCSRRSRASSPPPAWRSAR